MDAIDKIKDEDLTPDLKLLADICGIETIRTLLRNYSGLGFYIPKLTKLDNFIFRYLSQNDGKTLKEIAKELNVSENFLKKKYRERLNSKHIART